MADRIRVYELARELGLTSKELLEMLEEEGVDVKSHASTLEEDVSDLIRDQVIGQREAAAKSKGEPLVSQPEVDDQAEEAEEAEEEPAVDGAGIHLKPPITVRDLAKALGRKPNEIIGQLMTMNVFATINQVVEPDTVEKICNRYGFEFVRERRERAAKAAKPKSEEAAVTTAEPKVRKPIKGHVPRPPVVAFLGHVDHGKTSLLDAIRETQVTASEAGGITQHIGASVVEWRGQSITFLDTPGHEAFTAMRARGANATDIVVLVVAADDGVMPQTAEAIDHAKAAGVPLVVAMNKIDLPNANPEKVLRDLQQNDVMPEDWGGQTGVVPVSAVQGVGIDELLERILLEAEVMELKSNPSLPCDGIVIEAQLEPGMGPTANVLVRNGTLHLGDTILSGQYHGRVKALIDESGKRIKSAGPSTPVKILGLSGVPNAGDALIAMEDEREARSLAEERAMKTREGELEVTHHATLEDLFQQIADKARVDLRLIVKADVRGTLEAVIDSLTKLSTAKVQVDILHRGVGEVTENDVLLAAASNAIVIGFHVRAMPAVIRAAKQEGVEIRLYSIIYELLEDIEAAMRGKLEPELREEVIGQAEIKQIFDVSKTGRICGCVVNQGQVRVGANVRVIRGADLIYKGTIQSLRHFKDDVREMRAGQECGIRLDNFEDFEVGDKVEVVKVEKVAAKL